MKINRVTLYNFSSYVGENTIALDTHGVQNIILIGGNNGAGKTSFSLPSNWLYMVPNASAFRIKTTAIPHESKS